MSRLRLPRRFAVFAIVLAGACFGAPLAGAQRSSSNDPRAVQVIGSDQHSRRCVTGVVSGGSDDATMDACNRALRQPRLGEDAEVQLLLNRGVAHLRRDENDAALADFDAVIEINRRQPEAYLNRGAALVQMGQPGPAVAAITEALSLGVTEPHKAYFNRGAAREALGDLRGAYEDYSTALEIQPDWGPANDELARFVRGRQAHLANILGEPNP